MALTVTAIRRALRGAEYPASREELAEQAEENGADDDIIEAVRSLDEEDFDNVDSVLDALADELDDDSAEEE